ncbi:MAG: bifunctional diaminohydroxyphosphoribosylaminopyrimidine deaminase/5-amino-6-(5-phosphoribosylamino)uracil reductase RibD [Pirellulaceae bacterium]|nr:bifunctional diaminohydroxyphosphoribosylaminopyrimidine deaminase/5-amino-6-(5-phosphoribosylamino)uracil reductase RibD [Pirellulaceae bacterium]
MPQESENANQPIDAQPHDAQSIDAHWMELACQQARLGEGSVEPNPMVGCVLVRDGQLLASGFHARYGGPHAERVALANLASVTGPTGQTARGATAYVTLEPCCHYGQTPPCTDALIEAQVARVCCAISDPFPQVQGKGIDQLRAAGIQVDVMSPPYAGAVELLAPYWKRVTERLPYVIAKWAMSLDGKMATRTGDSRWISGPESRVHAHRTRGRVDAIIVGSRTARLDDPLLTARQGGPRTPLRVVVDSQASLSCESQLARTARESPVLVWTAANADPGRIEALRACGCRVQQSTSLDSTNVEAAAGVGEEDTLVQLLRYLVDEYRATNVLCEGGGQLLGALFDRQLIDEVHVYVAPKLIGGQSATVPCLGLGMELVALGPPLKVIERLTLGEDTFVRARRRHDVPGL